MIQKSGSYIKTAFLSLSILLMGSCFNEVLILPENIEDSKSFFKIDNREVAIDFENQLALAVVNDYGKDYTAYIKLGSVEKLIINNDTLDSTSVFTFTNVGFNSEWPVSLQTTDGLTYNLNLRFTSLPVIQLFHTIAVPEDIKVPATITLSAPEKSGFFRSYCGIETRGGQAESRPKKSYTIELCDDIDGYIPKSESLLNMRYDGTWLLDAMYIDKAKMRNRVSFDLWNQITGSRKYLPDYHRGFIQGKPVEVFINYTYKGIYFIEERIDAKQLGLSVEIGSTCGNLYKSEDWSDATNFISAADTIRDYFLWDGWEQKHPDPNIFSCWEPLYRLIDFIDDATDDDFEDGIFKLISKDNLIDYFILLNITKAGDNTGKNIFLAKEGEKEPFYICPWDMDATWGRFWDAEPDNSGRILSNNLYNRLFETDADNFNNDIKERWFELRKEVITRENIRTMFSFYSNAFEKSGAFSRETETWPASVNSLPDEMEYIEKWTADRILYLDNFFEELN